MPFPVRLLMTVVKARCIASQGVEAGGKKLTAILLPVGWLYLHVAETKQIEDAAWSSLGYQEGLTEGTRGGGTVSHAT